MQLTDPTSPSPHIHTRKTTPGVPDAPRRTSCETPSVTSAAAQSISAIFRPQEHSRSETSSHPQAHSKIETSSAPSEQEQSASAVVHLPEQSIRETPLTRRRTAHSNHHIHNNYGLDGPRGTYYGPGHSGLGPTTTLRTVEDLLPPYHYSTRAATHTTYYGSGR